MNKRNDLSDRRPVVPGGFAGREFFYSNLRIQEALTTIRYGIETRKGLILITGASGAGKTTLLRKTVGDLPANIVAVVVENPGIDFSGMLRLLMRSLSADETAEDEIPTDEPGMVRHCQALLCARLERCEIVALFIDDAQLLPDRTIRNLMQNFLAGGTERPEGALLQIVLAGSQALKTKLSQAALVPLRRRRPIVCELPPLGAGEIAAYIERGLAAGERPADCFDERAVKRVALLTDGNPRAINALCERSLQLGGTTVTAESIETAAENLRRSSGASPTPSEDPLFAPFNDDPFAGGEHDDNEEKLEFASRRSAAPDPAFFAHSRYERRLAWMPQGERLTSWVRGVTVLTLIIGAAAMIPAQSVVNLIARPAQHAADFAASSWQEYLKKDTAPPQELPSAPAPSEETAETVKGPSEAEVQKMAQPEILVPLAGPDRPAAIGETPPNRLTRAPDSPAPETRRAPTGKTVKMSADIRNRRDTGRQAPTAVKENLPPSRDLETEIVKAIASRAILGVEVSVVRGTAILDGHVATERQRRAAERAALSVSGVERVRNRIAITFG